MEFGQLPGATCRWGSSASGRKERPPPPPSCGEVDGAKGEEVGKGEVVAHQVA